MDARGTCNARRESKINSTLDEKTIHHLWTTLRIKADERTLCGRINNSAAEPAEETKCKANEATALISQKAEMLAPSENPIVTTKANNAREKTFHENAKCLSFCFST